jgi:hypothetical protein
MAEPAEGCARKAGVSTTRRTAATTKRPAQVFRTSVIMDIQQVTPAITLTKAEGNRKAIILIV